MKNPTHIYIFQLYDEKQGDHLSNVTLVEVRANNYADAIKQVPLLLKEGDDRKVRLHQIVLEKLT